MTAILGHEQHPYKLHTTLPAFGRQLYLTPNGQFTVSVWRELHIEKKPPFGNQRKWVVLCTKCTSSHSRDSAVHSLARK